MLIIKAMSVSNPTIEDWKLSLSWSNFTNPTLKTLLAKFSVKKIIIICSHELYTLITPYSSVFKTRVNMGVVIKESPFWSSEQKKYQNDTFNGSEMLLYLDLNLCTIDFTSFTPYYLCILKTNFLMFLFITSNM